MAIAERDEYFDTVERRYPASRPANLKSLEENVDELLDKLKLAYQNRAQIKLYSLNFREREAAEVLLQTGEATIYRGADGHSVIQYKASGLDSVLRALHLSRRSA